MAKRGSSQANKKQKEAEGPGENHKKKTYEKGCIPSMMCRNMQGLNKQDITVI